MDLSNVPTEDLHAIASGDMSRVSEPTLRYLSGQPQQPVEMAPDVSPAKVAAKTVGRDLEGMGESAGTAIANIPYGVGHTLVDLYHRVTGQGSKPDPALLRAIAVSNGAAGREFGQDAASRLEALSDRLHAGDAITGAVGAANHGVENFEQNHPMLAHTVIPAAADVAALAGARGIPGAVADATRSAGEGISGARALASGEGFDVGTEEPTAADVGLKAPNNPPLASHQRIGNTIAANEAGLPEGSELSQQSVEAAQKAPDSVYARLAKALPDGPLDKAAQERVKTAGQPEGGRVSKGSPQAQRLIEDVRQQLLAQKNGEGGEWTGQNWVNELKGLRRDGYGNLGSDDVSNQQLGRAQLEMARAIEDHIGRNIPADADVDLPQFQAARTALAKNHAVQGALRGNNVDMTALARMYRADPDLMTGGLQTLAKFADENPEIVRLSNRFAPDIDLYGVDVTRPATLLKPLQNAAARIMNARRSEQGAEAANREFPARSPAQFAPIDRTPQAPEGMTASIPEAPAGAAQNGGVPFADVLEHGGTQGGPIGGIKPGFRPPAAGAINVRTPAEPLTLAQEPPTGPSAAQRANAARVRQATAERLSARLPLRRGPVFDEGPMGGPTPAQRVNQARIAANRLRTLAARVRAGNEDEEEPTRNTEFSEPIRLRALGPNGDGFAHGGSVSPLEAYVDESARPGSADQYLNFLVRANEMKMGLPAADAIYDPVPGMADGGSTKRVTTMPWTPKDARRHTLKAKSSVAQRQWAHIANGALRRGEPEGVAIREANGVIARRARGGPMSSPLAVAINSGGPYLGHGSVGPGRDAMPMSFAHARARMPYIPIGDTMRNVDKLVTKSSNSLGKLRAGMKAPNVAQGAKTKFADGGLAELAADPEAAKAVNDALGYIKGGDHSSAGAALRSSRAAMRHPEIARAAERLKAADGLSPATIELQRWQNLMRTGEPSGEEGG